MTPTFRPATLLQATLQNAAEFVFPSRCAICSSADFSDENVGGSFCRNCATALCPTPINRCKRCGAEIGLYSVSDNGCSHCRDRPLRFDSVICLGMYEDLLRKAILSAKWSFSAVRTQSLAMLLARERAAELGALSIDRVVPIPQHWRKRLFNSFNPAWIIADRIASSLNKPCDAQVLRRSRLTRSQKRVAVSQRFENQADSFRLVNAQRCLEENVLLVDDVLTTGATCTQAARLLLAAGVKSCHVAVLGRVLDHSA